MKARLSLLAVVVLFFALVSFQVSYFTPKPKAKPVTKPMPEEVVITEPEKEPEMVINIPEAKPVRKVTHYPKDYFRAPVGIDMLLSGTFGELRTNHFHAGIDIKTQGKENLNIYAAAEGYVSRIKVSTGGYGTALYVDHPNGYTSVYAHLNKMNGDIGSYVKQRQYALQSFEFDEQVPPGLLHVHKGEVVAKSGNTGSSGGPHLHFEIRDTYTEEPINPLLFGLYVADTRQPLINSLAIYPFNIYNRHGDPQIYTVTGSGTACKVADGGVIMVKSSRIGLGLKTYDKQNGANNLNGIYSLELKENGLPVYSFTMDRLSFDETRYINSHIDFDLKMSGKGVTQKCFVDPGNKLTIYEELRSSGVIDLSDGLPHHFTFTVKDVQGNISTLNCTIQYDALVTIQAPMILDSYNASFSYAFPNNFDNGLVRLNFPEGAFYDDILFKYEMKDNTDPAVFSHRHLIHDHYTPVHKYFDIAIQPQNLPFDYYDKAVIAYKDRKGRIKSIGGQWEGNYLKAKSREFGEYFVAVDTEKPKIRPSTIVEGKNMAKNKTITLKISDDLSGIKSYNGYVDGQWILMEYDAKTTRLRYWFDERVPPGTHQFTLVVTDGVDNTNTYTANFRR